MTEKQYRLNKWGTKLLKNNRPLFDWFNESDEVVDLLNELHDENKELKTELEQAEMIFEDIKCADFKHELIKVKEENKELKKKIEELEFKLRTIEAYDRTAKEEHSDTVYDFKKKLEKW